MFILKCPSEACEGFTVASILKITTFTVKVLKGEMGDGICLFLTEAEKWDFMHWDWD